MELPSQVPVMTLPSATLFPQALLPLYIFESRYRKMLRDALKEHRMFIVAMQKPGRTREVPCGVAGLGLIRVSVDHQDGTSHLILQGIARVELGETVRYRPYRVQAIRPLPSQSADNVMTDALVAKLMELVRQRLELGPIPSPFPIVRDEPAKDDGKGPGVETNCVSSDEVLEYLDGLANPDHLTDLVSCALLPDAQQRQVLLETVNLETRLKHLIHFLIEEIERTGEKGN